MDIRKPNDSELKKVMLLSPQAVFDGTLGEVKPTNEKIKHLVEPLLEKGSYYLIATEIDKLMGWILIGSSKDQFTDKMSGFIYELFVIEEFRGNGISKRLMRTAIDHLRQDGYSEVRLSAFAENQAIKLYEKMGFNIRTVTMSLPL
ncbi:MULTISPECIES: GNAT family N-acetyltransferase [Peribacillus]|uniref:GNAT family N-acetyltransferase n=2 Tax=Peribacillus TaxID=2675229 RepID=A0AA90T836_9BACI|nr:MULTISPECIES: GNAT family N-acetyltransferase [Peribacillus]MBD8591244.1 GNAT family N-acetyltransferase [Peribacillus simplex]MCM3170486.1 GNAT family N-acetyltransferase [Peribacillus frigoritolerans]MDP1420336.1 GNAT family N-acetyltransferase [Peribacillus simplex]MDP1453417.1 GNAT family N-acetyltransferase [Peribacillus frigoritolerans]MDW7618000.1 GNAT family N-acetyltransferase [Peribacillus simplex]